MFSYKPCKKQLNKSYFTYFMCAMYFGLILQYTCIRPSDVTCFLELAPDYACAQGFAKLLREIGRGW